MHHTLSSGAICTPLLLRKGLRAQVPAKQKDSMFFVNGALSRTFFIQGALNGLCIVFSNSHIQYTAFMPAPNHARHTWTLTLRGAWVRTSNLAVSQKASGRTLLQSIKDDIERRSRLTIDMNG